MKIILFVLLFLPVVAQAQINKLCPEFTAYGAPHYKAQPGDQELCKTNYAVIHSCATKTPIAVMEFLTKEKIGGPAHRQDDFRVDPDVTADCQATLKDYAGNPYDRGHMAPAGNNTQSAAIMSESFFLSNMVPQVPNNNRGIWKQLETWERNWVEEGRDLYIISGGIYDAGHLVIGNGVGVPTRLYKIIFDKQKDTGIAYIMPNAPLPVGDLPKYQVTIKDVEKETGMNFNLTAPKAKK